MLRATVNEPVPLQMLASDGRTDLYARAQLLRSGAPPVLLDLPSLGSGLYGANHTPTEEGYVTVLYQFFMDSGYTVPAPYDLESEVLEVDSTKLKLLRLLGLMHENAVFDSQVYDPEGNLTSGFLAIYRDKASALARDPTAVLFTYRIAAAYTAGQLSFYRVTRET